MKSEFRSAKAPTLDDFFADILSGDAAEAPETSVFAIRRRLERAAAERGWADDAPRFVGGDGGDRFVSLSVERAASSPAFRNASFDAAASEEAGGAAPPNVWTAIARAKKTIRRTTGTDVAGVFFDRVGGALARACLLAVEATGRRLVLLPETANPDAASTVRAVATTSGLFDVRTVSAADGAMDVDDYLAILDAEGENVAAVVVPYPNFFGNFDQIGRIASDAKSVGAATAAAIDPFAAAALKSPVDRGADLVAGEIRPNGTRANFNAPRFGFVGATAEFARRLPRRRIVETVGENGRRAFEPAFGEAFRTTETSSKTSEKSRWNADSPERVDALTALAAFAFVEPAERRRAANAARTLAEYARAELRKAGFSFLEGASLSDRDQAPPFFREFVVKTDNPSGTNRFLLDWGIVGGLELKDGLLLAFSETQTREEVDELVYLMKKFRDDENARFP